MPATIRLGESTPMRRHASRALLICAALWLQTCRTDRAGDLLAQERASVAEWTLPPGATIAGATDLSRTADGVVATWDVSTTMTWSEYKVWIGSRARMGYRQMTSNGGRLSYARQLPGDALLVDVAVAMAGPPLGLRIVFSGHPD
jgi:hypothetical protein